MCAEAVTEKINLRYDQPIDLLLYVLNTRCEADAEIERLNVILREYIAQAPGHIRATEGDE